MEKDTYIRQVSKKEQFTPVPSHRKRASSQCARRRGLVVVSHLVGSTMVQAREVFVQVDEEVPDDEDEASRGVEGEDATAVRVRRIPTGRVRGVVLARRFHHHNNNQ